MASKRTSCAHPTVALLMWIVFSALIVPAAQATQGVSDAPPSAHCQDRADSDEDGPEHDCPFCTTTLPCNPFDCSCASIPALAVVALDSARAERAVLRSARRSRHYSVYLKLPLRPPIPTA